MRFVNTKDDNKYLEGGNWHLCNRNIQREDIVGVVVQVFTKTANYKVDDAVLL